MTGLKRGTVSLSPHDPEWAGKAQEIINVLWEVFGDTAEDIQHIGSTAIDGIQAKPIIDIAVGVDSMEDLPLERLIERGFQERYNRFSSNLLYVLETEDRVRTHQVHILPYDCLQWHNYVDLRDYMNAFPEKAKEYERLKLRLAQECNNVQTAYTDGKHDYMEVTLAEARAYASGLNPRKDDTNEAERQFPEP